MALVEICNSTYNHLPIYNFGKKYFKHRFKNKIICDECLDAYYKEVADTLSSEIFNCLKNVDMQSRFVTNDVHRIENFSFTFEKELINTYMQYILPIKFEMNVYFTYENLKRYMDSDYLDMATAISAVTNAPLTSTRIARVTIKPIVCDSSYPSFNIGLDIRKTDNLETIGTQIFEYMNSFVNSFFTQIPDNEVIMLMNDTTSSTYTSSASTCGMKCSKCGVAVSMENYIYQNNIYCLDFMY